MSTALEKEIYVEPKSYCGCNDIGISESAARINTGKVTANSVANNVIISVVSGTFLITGDSLRELPMLKGFERRGLIRWDKAIGMFIILRRHIKDFVSAINKINWYAEVILPTAPQLSLI